MADRKALVLGTSQRTSQIPDADTLIVGTGVDAASAGALAIGASTATSVSVTPVTTFAAAINADGGIERSTNGTLVIGNDANTTALTIGRAGISATFPGDVTISGTETVVSTTTFQGNVDIGDDTGDLLTITSRLDSAVNFLQSQDSTISVDQSTTAGDVGGTLTVSAGEGGDGSGAGTAGGAGGARTDSGGVGGAANGTDAAGAGGAYIAQGGDGGAGSASAAAGAGASASLLGGDAGADGGGGGANGGNAVVDAGAATGAGTDGSVSIGTTNATAITLGNATNNTTISQTGSGQVTFNGNVDAAAGLDVTGRISSNGSSADLLLSERSADPTNAANTGFLYVKDDGGDTELYYRDDSGNVVQITQDGSVNATGGAITGTSNDTFTINDDIVAGDNEESCLILRTADAAGETNSIFLGDLCLRDDGAGVTRFELKTTDDGSPTATSLHVGQLAAINDIDARLQFNAGDGTNAVTSSLVVDGTNDDLIITGPSGGAVSVATNLDAEAGLDVTGGDFTHASGGTGNVDVAWDFSGGVTFSGNEVLVSGGNVQLNDNITLSLGTSDDLQISHGGTDSTISSATGNLVIDNTNASGITILRLGTDTAATDVQVRNNSDAVLFEVNGAGLTTMNGDVDIGDASSDLLTITARLDADLHFQQSLNSTIDVDQSTTAGDVGGTLTVTSGTGGDTDGVGGAAGSGGKATYLAGVGGDAGAGAGAAGIGGETEVTGGTGGAGSGTGVAGAGGVLTLSAGSAGANGGAGGANGGSVTLNAGSGTGAGTNGDIDIGSVAAVDISLGNATDNTTITQVGSGQVTFTGNVDATNGLDVTTADLTVGGANFSVAQSDGDIITAGSLRFGEVSAPTNVANTGFIYVKDDGGDTELYYMDDGGAEVQITADGSLNVSGNDVTYTADAGGIAAGEVVRMATDGTIGEAQADAAADIIPTLGVAPSAITGSSSGSVRIDGKVDVQLEGSLTVDEGDELFVSAAVEGLATNVAPSTGGQFIKFLGIVTDASAYGGTQGDTVEVQLMLGERAIAL